MAINPVLKGQIDFMLRGGPLEMALYQLRERGILPEAGSYVHQEYPKALNLSVAGPGGRDVIVPMVVQNEAEEDAVRAAFERAEDLGITVRPEWTAALLLHAVKVAEVPKPRRNAPRPTPEQIVAERIATLKAELAALEPAEEIDAVPVGAVEATHPAAHAPKCHRIAPSADLPVVAPDPAV